jgi:uncharacterized protein YjbI with pentapeptide repeats
LPKKLNELSFFSARFSLGWGWEMHTGNEISSEKVKKILSDHDIWIASHGKRGEIADLSGLDLRFIDLRKFNLRKANLSNANLKGSNLSGVNLYGANLQDANLERTHLEGARLEEANLVKANLKAATLARADLRGANLNKANLVAANLEEACLVEANLMEADLERANLNYADLEGAVIADSNLRKALLNFTNLEDTILDGANLKEAQLKKSNLFCASIDQADFERANLKNANLGRVEMDETCFVDANLEGAQFDDNDFQCARLDTTLILNNNEKSTGRKFPPSFFTKEVTPYINAISDIQRIIGKVQNRRTGEISINAVSRGSGIMIELSGAKEILPFIKDEVLAWRKKHFESLARLSEIRRKNAVRIERAKVLALKSLIKKNKRESDKLATKALKITAEMMRNKVEAEKIRKMNNQKELANKFLRKTLSGLPEIKNETVRKRLIDRLNYIVESDLAD